MIWRFWGNIELSQRDIAAGFISKLDSERGRKLNSLNPAKKNETYVPAHPTSAFSTQFVKWSNFWGSHRSIQIDRLKCAQSLIASIIYVKQFRHRVVRQFGVYEIDCLTEPSAGSAGC